MSHGRLDLLQVESGGASVLLLGGGTGLLHDQLAGGDGVLAGLVGAGGDLLADLEDEAAVGLGDGPGAGGLLAGAVGDLGQAAVRDDLGAAVLGLRLHGAGLEEAELVAGRRCVCQYLPGICVWACHHGIGTGRVMVGNWLILTRTERCGGCTRRRSRRP